MFGPVGLNLAQGAGVWLEGTLSLKVPISGKPASFRTPGTGSHRSWEGAVSLPEWELLA